jgi:hypothetical protein
LRPDVGSGQILRVTRQSGSRGIAVVPTAEFRAPRTAGGGRPRKFVKGLFSPPVICADRSCRCFALENLEDSPGDVAKAASLHFQAPRRREQHQRPLRSRSRIPGVAVLYIRMMSFIMPRAAMRAWVPTVERTSRLSHAAGTRFRERPSCDPHVICNAVPTLPEETMADVEQFKDDLENNAEGLVGGSRGDFMEALGEAVYSRVAVTSWTTSFRRT